MKLRRDTITGIAGLFVCTFFFYGAQMIRQPPNLLEPGPKLLPYTALFLVAVSSVALIIKGLKDSRPADKKYFPMGGVKKITRSYLLLMVYAAAMTFLGFLITPPFATYIFIYDLKGNSKVKPVLAAIISVLLTIGLYVMFVFGFRIKVPVGIVFE